MAIMKVVGNNSLIWAELCNELWPHISVNEMLDGFNNEEYQKTNFYTKSTECMLRLLA